MNWYNKIKIAQPIIGYHATKEEFNQFDLAFAKDELGMKIHEGLGHNKFYFAKDKSRAIS